MGGRGRKGGKGKGKQAQQAPAPVVDREAEKMRDLIQKRDNGKKLSAKERKLLADYEFEHPNAGKAMKKEEPKDEESKPEGKKGQQQQQGGKKGGKQQQKKQAAGAVTGDDIPEAVVELIRKAISDAIPETGMMGPIDLEFRDRGTDFTTDVSNDIFRAVLEMEGQSGGGKGKKGKKGKKKYANAKSVATKIEACMPYGGDEDICAAVNVQGNGLLCIRLNEDLNNDEEDMMTESENEGIEESKESAEDMKKESSHDDDGDDDDSSDEGDFDETLAIETLKTLVKDAITAAIPESKMVPVGAEFVNEDGIFKTDVAQDIFEGVSELDGPAKKGKGKKGKGKKKYPNARSIAVKIKQQLKDDRLTSIIVLPDGDISIGIDESAFTVATPTPAVTETPVESESEEEEEPIVVEKPKSKKKAATNKFAFSESSDEEEEEEEEEEDMEVDIKELSEPQPLTKLPIPSSMPKSRLMAPTGSTNKSARKSIGNRTEGVGSNLADLLSTPLTSRLTSSITPSRSSVSSLRPPTDMLLSSIQKTEKKAANNKITPGEESLPKKSDDSVVGSIISNNICSSISKKRLPRRSGLSLSPAPSLLGSQTKRSIIPTELSKPSPTPLQVRFDDKPIQASPAKSHLIDDHKKSLTSSNDDDNEITDLVSPPKPKLSKEESSISKERTITDKEEEDNDDKDNEDKEQIKDKPIISSNPTPIETKADSNKTNKSAPSSAQSTPASTPTSKRSKKSLKSTSKRSKKQVTLQELWNRVPGSVFSSNNGSSNKEAPTNPTEFESKNASKPTTANQNDTNKINKSNDEEKVVELEDIDNNMNIDNTDTAEAEEKVIKTKTPKSQTTKVEQKKEVKKRKRKRDEMEIEEVSQDDGTIEPPTKRPKIKKSAKSSKARRIDAMLKSVVKQKKKKKLVSDEKDSIEMNMEITETKEEKKSTKMNIKNKVDKKDTPETEKKTKQTSKTKSKKLKPIIEDEPSSDGDDDNEISDHDSDEDPLIYSDEEDGIPECSVCGEHWTKRQDREDDLCCCCVTCSKWIHSNCDRLVLCERNRNKLEGDDYDYLCPSCAKLKSKRGSLKKKK
eukprot:TRINITY_DN228_c1_g1_i2.p1 TRINITY_DN228_c1_g1~~TRINITY_DN228_c1_g1_i2.p1  ORF type:complete len:1079 (+),score=495.56 TRINITY_DN228_c1_g1_i2:908-4144(+)